MRRSASTLRSEDAVESCLRPAHACSRCPRPWGAPTATSLHCSLAVTLLTTAVASLIVQILVHLLAALLMILFQKQRGSNWGHGGGGNLILLSCLLCSALRLQQCANGISCARCPLETLVCFDQERMLAESRLFFCDGLSAVRSKQEGFLPLLRLSAIRHTLGTTPLSCRGLYKFSTDGSTGSVGRQLRIRVLGGQSSSID